MRCPQRSGLRARVRSAELELSGPSLVARDVELDDAAGHAVLRARTLRVQTTFSSLLGGALALRALDLSGVTLTLGDDARALLRRQARSARAGRSTRSRCTTRTCASCSTPARRSRCARPTCACKPRPARCSAQLTASDCVLERDGARRRAGERARAGEQFGAAPVLLGSQGQVELDAAARAPTSTCSSARRCKFTSSAIASISPGRSRCARGSVRSTCRSAGRARPARSRCALKPHALRFAALAAQLGWQAPWLDARARR